MKKLASSRLAAAQRAFVAIVALAVFTMLTTGSAQATVSGLFSAAPDGYKSGDGYVTRGVAEDVTGDGVVDLVSLGEDGAGVSILRGIGNGTFASAEFFSVGGLPVDIEAGDFTGDGVSDAVVLDNSENKLKVLTVEAVKTGGLSVKISEVSLSASVYATTALSAHTSLDVGDLDNDGDDDVIVGANHYPDTSFYLGFSTVEQEEASSTDRLKWAADYEAPSVPTEGSSGSYGANLEDLTGDGNLDYVMTTASGQLIVARGTGKGTFSSADGSAFSLRSTGDIVEGSLAIPFSNGAAAPLIEDINADGFQDILVTSADLVKVFYTNGDWSGSSASAVDTTAVTALEMMRISRTSKHYVAMQADDLNGDGITDVLVTCGGTVGFLIGSKDGSLKFDSALSVNSQSTSLTISKDLNADVIPDLVTFGGRLTEHSYEDGSVAVRTAGRSSDIGSGDSDFDWNDSEDEVDTGEESGQKAESVSVNNVANLVQELGEAESSESALPLCSQSLYVAKKSAARSKSKSIGSKRAYIEGPSDGQVTQGEKPSFIVRLKGSASTTRRIRKAVFYLNDEKLETVDSPVFGLKLVTGALKAATSSGQKYTMKVKVYASRGKTVTLKLPFYLNECKSSLFGASVHGVSHRGDGRSGVSMSASTGDATASKATFKLSRRIRMNVRRGKTVGKLTLTSKNGRKSELLVVPKGISEFSKTFTLLDKEGLIVTLKRGKRGGQITLDGLPEGTTGIKLKLSKAGKLVSVRKYCSTAWFKVVLETEGQEGLSLLSTPKHRCKSS